MKTFRIISLCPSTTATLIDLGLKECIVGRTKFCIHPKEEVKDIAKVGGTKNPKFEKIKALNPTHILFNMEENEAMHLELMQEIAETVVTTPVDIQSTKQMIEIFGELFHVSEKAKQLCTEIDMCVSNLPKYPPFSYLYFIWNEPHMVAGKHTYIDFMLSLIGGRNKANELSDERYLEVKGKPQADYVFLSSEPFPFKDKHIETYKKFSDQVHLIDGEMVSWHGSYTIKGLQYLKSYFNTLFQKN